VNNPTIIEGIKNVILFGIVRSGMNLFFSKIICVIEILPERNRGSRLEKKISIENISQLIYRSS